VLGRAPAATVLAVGPERLSDQVYNEVMRSMPIPTVDVLIFSADLSKTLLFKRRSRPVQHVYYSIGGRLFKNERLRHAALRKLREETLLSVAASDLLLGGVVEEIFEDSMFNSTNSHCINSVFGYVVPDAKQEAALKHALGDSQHSEAAWYAVDDPALHPYMRRKLLLLLPLLHNRRVSAALSVLDASEAPVRLGRKDLGRKDRRARKIAKLAQS